LNPPSPRCGCAPRPPKALAPAPAHPRSAQGFSDASKTNHAGCECVIVHGASWCEMQSNSARVRVQRISGDLKPQVEALESMTESPANPAVADSNPGKTRCRGHQATGLIGDLCSSL
jgi:hypothetical protein